MASAIATEKPDRRWFGRAGVGAAGADGRRRWLPGSRLGRLIISLNLVGLVILIVGVLVLNEFRQGLIQARTDSLRIQGQFMDELLVISATRGDPEPTLDAEMASQLLQVLSIPSSQRVRLFDRYGQVIFDSELVADKVEQTLLPPAHKRGDKPLRPPSLLPREPEAKREAEARAALQHEVKAALGGQLVVGGLRTTAAGERVVSVSLPVQHEKAVLGVLTLEAGDIDKIIAAQRLAMIPFILVAIVASVFTSLLLSALIAQPVLRLARAADRVRQARARAISLPDLARRDDELGDLTRSLEAMTDALSTRIDAIESFAADVAHEIRNPLTSIRSAIDTLPLVKDETKRERLNAILQQDIQRLDRLITDISNASRLDAELSREPPRAFDLGRLLSEFVGHYNASARKGDAPVQFTDTDGDSALLVSGREGPIGQVFRNLIDNARSFSPPGGKVRVQVGRVGRKVTATVDDDGPGVPPDNLETVFERFYTSRPKGAAFGHNSGLGLSIARQIVEAHGGRIWAENRQDAEGKVEGARFAVEFPEAPSARPPGWHGHDASDRHGSDRPDRHGR
ncbi:MAG TPA: stimulus-sensing domain-containing protein [Caulobacteraceae bacterium]|jgi:two-component system sensor histidine kinase ChvG